MEMPTPDPALKRLDRFVGTWELKGRTLDSDVDNVTGRTTFEWLPGGFFLQPQVELDFAGFEIRGLEVIGYDPARRGREAASSVFAACCGRIEANRNHGGCLGAIEQEAKWVSSSTTNRRTSSAPMCGRSPA